MKVEQKKGGSVYWVAAFLLIALVAYRPLLWECNNGPEPVATALHWWASFGIPSQHRMLE